MKIHYPAIIWTILSYTVSVVYGYQTFSWKYLAFAFFLHLLFGVGITLGAHRAFSHKTFEAGAGVYNVLAFLYLLSFDRCGQPLLSWVVAHDQHHKYTDKEGDPHSPIHGWLWSFCGHHLFRNEEHWNPAIYRQNVILKQKKYQHFFVKIADNELAMWGTQLIMIILCGIFGYLRGGEQKAFDFIVWFVFVRFTITATAHGFLDLLNHAPDNMWPLYLIPDTYGTKTLAINQFLLGAVQALNECTHGRHHAWPNIAGQQTTWRIWEQDADGLIMWLLEKTRIISNCKWLTEEQVKKRKEHAKILKINDIRN